ncbi:MAG: hypothetical protein ACTHLJ_07915 [Angustibacter sp.]
MAEIMRDLVTGFGGKWPVIGGLVFIGAFLGWLAYKAYEDHSPGGAGFLGLLAVAAFALAVTSMPLARAGCRTLWQEDAQKYTDSNCEVLVHCMAGVLDPSRRCS